MLICVFVFFFEWRSGYSSTGIFSTGIFGYSMTW